MCCNMQYLSFLSRQSDYLIDVNFYSLYLSYLLKNDVMKAEIDKNPCMHLYNFRECHLYIVRDYKYYTWCKIQTLIKLARTDNFKS